MKFYPSYLLFLIVVFQHSTAYSQNRTQAIYADSSAFCGWANACTVNRGWMNCSDTSLGKVNYGLETDALQKADNQVISLGDGGFAILEFPMLIANGSGYDFAVFENSFNDNFLELAFVEVSSNGIDFFRFPALSQIPDSPQIETFGTIQAELIHNFAGKFKVLYGTPFNLDDILDSPLLDKNVIRFVKVIDVVGSVLPEFARFDSQNNIVNDPWTTPFETGGFDLDAVGVIHQANEINTHFINNTFHFYPNPVENTIYFSDFSNIETIQIFSTSGVLVMQSNGINAWNIENLTSGIYIISIEKRTEVSKSIFVKK